ncbi:MAG TPA: imidazolonepropionase [Bacteroidales bacterium]|nr:imidazolonepropionase [Bacteroidales bacterium]HBZ20817.1 imidazolonepropionase [Bacteroidales bacterium]
MPLLIKNIKGLIGIEEHPQHKRCGRDMKILDQITDAYIFIEGDKISGFGSMDDIPDGQVQNNSHDVEVIDASGKFVFPSFCDSHTHLVYAGSREMEFSDRISGLSYEEIARRGGGILNSARKLHETTENDLYEQSMIRINEIILQGTGAVEIKSGYGLNTEDEIKMLRVIRRIKKNSLLEVKSTFLGAHAIPEPYRNIRDQYIGLIINEMIPVIASEELSDYIDVFCDKGFFTVEETEQILMAGLKYGLTPKLHANEIANSGGVQVGVKYNALSVDHLEHTGADEINALLNSDTMPTLLPGSALFLGLPDPPARKLIEAGLPVALASDFNPGSSPSGNMKLVMSLGCIKLKMTPEEAINAVTINSAYAMGISETHGSFAMGKTANMFITSEMPSYSFFPYAYGSNLIDKVILKGKIVN